MHALGMSVRLDGAGNLRGVYPAQAYSAPTLLIGSHIDTVPDAGRYDGILGVALPLALLATLPPCSLPFHIEIVAFSEEEGIRFRTPFLGSRALAGTLTDDILDRRDAQGISVAQALDGFGVNRSETAALTPATFAFLEVHIEQGPVLDTLALPLGVVETIVGQTRLELTFTGEANHAGTTPMPLRRDALAAAAAFIASVEAHANEQANTTPGLVATVGAIEAHTPAHPTSSPAASGSRSISATPTTAPACVSAACAPARHGASRIPAAWRYASARPASRLRSP